MILPLLIAMLLGFSALLIVIHPLLGLDRAAHAVLAPEAIADASDAAERERLAKQALRDVDFDYRLGNLDEGDYASLRERYERRALAALKTRYEREQELDAQIDRQLAALRAQEPKKNGHVPEKEPRQATHDDVKSGNNGNNVAGSRQSGPRARRRKGM